jgi:hypothetical protein
LPLIVRVRLADPDLEDGLEQFAAGSGHVCDLDALPAADQVVVGRRAS